MTLIDTIVAGNTGGDIVGKGGENGAYSLIGDGRFEGIGTNGNLSGPAELAALANNGVGTGGPQTMATGPESQAIENGGAVTILTLGIGSTDTTLHVANAAAIESSNAGIGITIDGEYMTVTGVNLAANTLTVERSPLGPNPAPTSHNKDASIYLAFDERGQDIFGDYPNGAGWPAVVLLPTIGAYQDWAVSNTASRVTISGPTTLTAGQSYAFAIQALDSTNHQPMLDNDTVTLISTAPGMTPIQVTLQDGRGQATVTLDKATSSASLTATDTSLNLTSPPFQFQVIGAAPVTGTLTASPSTVKVGAPVTLSLMGAKDAYGNPANGTLSVGCLSGAESFAQVDLNVTNGQGNFTVSLPSPDTNVQFRAYDPPGFATIVATSNAITVLGPPAHVSISGPASVQSGQSFPVEVSATDADGLAVDTQYPVTFTCTNTATGATQTVTVGSSSFSNGVDTVNLTLYPKGTYTLTATENGITSPGFTVTVTPGPPEPTSTTPNQAGYIAYNSPATAVGGSWVEPSGSGPNGAEASFWVGLSDSPNVEQIGTQVVMSNGSSQYSAWYEMISTNQPEVPITTTNAGTPFVVNPNDQISAEVVYQGTSGGVSTFFLQITDTEGSNGPNSGTVEVFTTTQMLAVQNIASAEWMAEAPTVNGQVVTLANFGQVNFQGAWATIGSTTGPITSFSGVKALDIVQNGVQVTTTSNPPTISSSPGFQEAAQANGLDSSSFTVTYGAVVGQVPPKASSNLTATAVATNQVNLAWVDNGSNATSLVVQRSSDGAYWTTLATLAGTATSYSDTSVSAGTTCYYRVYAANSFGNSPYSNGSAANGNVLTYNYTNGVLSTATLTNSRGTLLQTYNYNAQDQATSIVYANGNVLTYTYKGDGSSTAALKNSSGTLLDGYSYNAQGQLTSEVVYETNGNVYSRTYNADGSSTATLTNSSGTVASGVTSISYAYNAQGVLTAYDYYYTNGNVFARTYNSDGSSTATLANSSGTLLDDYSYNAQGQFTAYDTYYANGDVFHHVYAADGSSTATLSNGSGSVLETYYYNAQGELTSESPGR